LDLTIQNLKEQAGEGGWEKEDERMWIYNGRQRENMKAGFGVSDDISEWP
jgi:hypothetical protein